MIRGTTPTHRFKLPFHVENVKEAMVIYAQDNVEVFHKKASDCEMTNNEISVTLTQEETLQFDCNKNVHVQLRVLTIDGKAMASPIKVVDVERCLNNEVLQ